MSRGVAIFKLDYLSIPIRKIVQPPLNQLPAAPVSPAPALLVHPSRGPLCATRVRRRRPAAQRPALPTLQRAAARYARIQMHASRIHPAQRRKHRPKSAAGHASACMRPVALLAPHYAVTPLRTPRGRIRTALCHLRHHTTAGWPGASRGRGVQHERGVTDPRSFAHPASTVPGSAMSGGARRELALIPWTRATFTTQHQAVGVLERALRACCACRVQEDARAARREVPRHGKGVAHTSERHVHYPRRGISITHSSRRSAMAGRQERWTRRWGNSFDDEDLEEGVANDYARELQDAEPYAPPSNHRFSSLLSHLERQECHNFENLLAQLVVLA
ncbi:hypothetical protein B0H11DRAFT_1940578 [Mycena galericulata]|nr:hypothetical protein B0H11DRAFT_1940578 [Mycena galericulata]